MLFRSLLEKITQVVRLIRSKGVGVYFITQNPSDIPSDVLTQLGNKVLHALRGYTPQEQKAIRAAAQSFRVNPAFSTEQAITTLATGEALVSFLEPSGTPSIVEKALILPPESRVGAISDAERQAIIESSRFVGYYDRIIDRESAYELLESYFSERQEAARVEQEAKEEAKRVKEATRLEREAQREAKRKAKGNPDVLGTMMDSVGKQVGRTISTTVGREIGQRIVRGILGGIFGGKR